MMESDLELSALCALPHKSVLLVDKCSMLAVLFLLYLLHRDRLINPLAKVHQDREPESPRRLKAHSPS